MSKIAARATRPTSLVSGGILTTRDWILLVIPEATGDIKAGGWPVGRVRLRDLYATRYEAYAKNVK